MGAHIPLAALLDSVARAFCTFRHGFSESFEESLALTSTPESFENDFGYCEGYRPLRLAGH